MRSSVQLSSRLNIGSMLSVAACLLAGPVSAQPLQFVGKVSCTNNDPVANVTVIATSLTNQAQVASAVTDLNGNYAITVADLFFYDISLTNLPANLSPVDPPDGVHEARLPFGSTDPVNFVVAGCGSPPPPPTGMIGGWVWEDLNCDGIQDCDEPGSANVEVILVYCDGQVLAGTTTDTDGYYWFTDLEPSDYYLQFVAPVGCGFSPFNQDSTADPETGATVCFTLQAGETNLMWDAGLCCLEAPGVRSQGYWKNHPEAWPVDEIEIGGVTYHMWEAILIMREPTKGDKWLNLFEQLVAAKLNLLLGNQSDCIGGTIVCADMWLETTSRPVRARSNAWKNLGRHLHAELDEYNNGHLCAPYAE